MKDLRLRILALLAAIPILLGLVVPAVAAPCAEGTGTASSMTCNVCLDGILPGATICAAASPAVPVLDQPGARPLQLESRAWFGEPALNPHFFETAPDSPPPR